MSRADFTRAITDERSGDVVLTLMTLSSPDLPAPLYFTFNDEDVISRGNPYLRSGFVFTPPATGTDGQASATLSLDNTDGRLPRLIKDLDSAPQVLFEMVLASDPDTVHETWPPFDFTAIQWSLSRVDGSLTIPDDSGEPAMAIKMTPATAPGAFAA